MKTKIQKSKQQDSIKMPRWLFESAQGRAMTNTEKIVYALLNDRISFSERNGWVDENGDLYVHFRQSSLARRTGFSARAIVMAMQTLREIGLIETVVVTPGKPQRIYVHTPDFDVMYAEDSGKEDEFLDESPEKEADVLPNGVVPWPGYAKTEKSGKPEKMDLCNPEGDSTRSCDSINLKDAYVPSLPKETSKDSFSTDHGLDFSRNDYIPQWIQSEKYAGLSMHAIFLYAKMLSRQNLSVRNNWADEEGRYFIFFPMREVEHVLRLKTRQAKSVFAELKKAGLLLVGKKNFGGNPRLYLLGDNQG